MLSRSETIVSFEWNFCGTVLRADFISKSALWRICSVTVNVFFMSLVFPRKHRRARLGRSHPRILPIFPCADSLCMSYPTTNTFNPDSIPSNLSPYVQSHSISSATALMFCVREGILDEESRPLPCADPKQLHFRGDIEWLLQWAPQEMLVTFASDICLVAQWGPLLFAEARDFGQGEGWGDWLQPLQPQGRMARDQDRKSSERCNVDRIDSIDAWPVEGTNMY